MQLSIRNFRETIENDRVDAEYFGPEYIQSDRFLKTKTCKTLGTITHISDGNHLSIAENFLDKPGIRYLRGQDLSTEMVLSDRNIVYIDEVIFRQLKRSHIFKNDILITIVGANTGLVGLVYAPPDKLVASCKLGIVRPQKGILSGYLYALLTSQYGQNQILRSIRGGGQTGLILPDIRKLSIARFEDTFEDYIHQIVYQGHELIEQAENIYCEAEKILLSELGLLNWKPKHHQAFVKNFSDTQASERIDAEYFQPKYEEVVKQIKQYKKGYNHLDEIVKVKDKNFQPQDDVVYRYIELANISTNGNISGFIEAQGKDLPTRARRKVNTGDVIVSTIEGSLSSIALISEDLDNALCSTGFFVITSEKINSETLLIFLKSLAGQLQLKKGCSGTILTAIGDDEFRRIILPDLSSNIQLDIKNKISEMYKAKALSKHLLGIAKHAVEMAVEKNEAIAAKWIKAEVKKLGVEIAT